MNYKNNALSISKEVIDHLSKIGCITISIKSIVSSCWGNYSISIKYLKEVSLLKNEEYLIPLGILKKSVAINDFRPQRPINNLLIY